MIGNPLADPETHWYMRSTGDHDTHRGWYSDVTRTVRTVCGIEFVPRPLAGYRGALAFPGQPPDPEQACVACRQGVAAERES